MLVLLHRSKGYHAAYAEDRRRLDDGGESFGFFFSSKEAVSFRRFFTNTSWNYRNGAFESVLMVMEGLLFTHKIKSRNLLIFSRIARKAKVLLGPG